MDKKAINLVYGDIDRFKWVAFVCYLILFAVYKVQPSSMQQKL